MKATKKDLHESGRPYTKEEFIEKIKVDDNFANRWGNLGPIYGAQWRYWFAPECCPTNESENGKIINDEYSEKFIDQIANLINDLKTNPDSRRLMVNAWNVGEVPQMVLPPCHYGFQCYTTELTLDERKVYHKTPDIFEEIFGYNWTSLMGLESLDLETKSNLHKSFDKLQIPRRKISLMWNQRSVDTFLGLPYNIASYGLLLEILAKEVNMVPDELIGNLGDTHLYLNHLDQANEQLGRECFDLPTVRITQPTYSEDIPVLTGFSVNNFELIGYEAHASIKAQLSN